MLMSLCLCYRDVRLKAQLEQVAEGVRYVMQSSEPSSSPYGDGWDVLWLGQYARFSAVECCANKETAVAARYSLRRSRRTRGSQSTLNTL